jgi:hypothetical protein
LFEALGSITSIKKKSINFKLVQWLMSVILATLEAELGSTAVQDQLG